MNSQETFQPGRRDFGKMALGGALGALLAPQESKASVHPNAPGIKLCAQSGATPSDDQLLFLKQIGAEYVSVGAPPDMRTAEGFLAIKKRYADAGVTVWNIGNTSVHNMQEVTLNLPGRDRKIEEYKQYIRNLGKAGIYYTTYAHMGNGIWSSGRAKTRGCPTREFDMASPNKRGVWDGKTWAEPLSHGREFTKEEIWENFTYFIKQVAPVAEEDSVRIGIHPDDPPVPVLAGVPRCIFGNFEGYKRAHGDRRQPQRGDLSVLRDVAGGWEGADRERPRRDDPLFRRRQDLEDPFPQRHRAAAAFHRDLHGQRLLRHVQDHEGAPRCELRRHRDSGPFARDGG